MSMKRRLAALRGSARALGLALVMVASGSPAAASVQDVLQIEAALAMELGLMQQLLAWQDAIDRIAVASGQLDAAQADARLAAYAAQLLQADSGPDEVAEQGRRLAEASAAWLEAIERQVAASTTWPEGGDPAAWRVRASAALAAQRAELQRWLAAGLDPTLVLVQVGYIAGWTRGEARPGNPFAGHGARIAAAVPDPVARTRIAAIMAPVPAPDAAAPEPPAQIPAVPNPLTRHQPPAALDSVLLGCFRDTSAYDLDGYLERSPTNTPRSCIERCSARGFRYAAVQYGESCLCGNHYGRYGPAQNCDMACTGDPGQTCGGYNANAVYRTGSADGSAVDPHDGLEDGIDRPGSDFESFDLAEPDPVLCRLACQDTAGCKAFTYVRPGVQGALARCWLKSVVPAAVPSACCISGVR